MSVLADVTAMSKGKGHKQQQQPLIRRDKAEILTEQ
jgi:hypothetical protein